MPRPSLRQIFLDPVFARERLLKLQQPRSVPVMERIRKHLKTLYKDPKNIPAAAMDMAPFGAMMTTLAIPALLRHKSPSNVGGFLGGFLGGNIMQRAGIRASLAGGAAGDIVGRSLGKLLEKGKKRRANDVYRAGPMAVPGRVQDLAGGTPFIHTAGIKAVVKRANQERRTIFNQGSASYSPDDAATPMGMDQSDKIPYEDQGAEDRPGSGDVDQSGRRRGLRTIHTFGGPNADTPTGTDGAQSPQSFTAFSDQQGTEFSQLTNPRYYTSTDIHNEEPSEDEKGVFQAMPKSRTPVLRF